MKIMPISLEATQLEAGLQESESKQEWAIRATQFENILMSAARELSGGSLMLNPGKSEYVVDPETGRIYLNFTFTSTPAIPNSEKKLSDFKDFLEQQGLIPPELRKQFSVILKSYNPRQAGLVIEEDRMAIQTWGEIGAMEERLYAGKNTGRLLDLFHDNDEETYARTLKKLTHMQTLIAERLSETISGIDIPQLFRNLSRAQLALQAASRKGENFPNLEQEVATLEAKAIEKLARLDASTLSLDHLWKLMTGLSRCLPKELDLRSRALKECRRRLEKAFLALGIAPEAIRNIILTDDPHAEQLVIILDGVDRETELRLRDHLEAKAGTLFQNQFDIDPDTKVLILRINQSDFALDHLIQA